MSRKLLFAFLLALAAAPLRAATYAVDPAHSEVTFKIRHLVGKVSGRFDKFEGSFDYDANALSAFKAHGSIDATTINTNNAKRDEHLRSPDFFDVQKFPTLTFVSTGVEAINGTKAKLNGNMTIHGITKPVVFDIEFLGTIKDPWGAERSSVSATTTIKRSDFGVVWNKTLEAGGLMLGEDVEISIDIEGVNKP